MKTVKISVSQEQTSLCIRTRTEKKKDLIKVDFDLSLPPTDNNNIDEVNAEIQRILQTCLGKTEKANVIDEGKIIINQATIGRYDPCKIEFENDCHELAKCVGNNSTLQYQCTCVPGTTDNNPTDPGKSCIATAVAGSEAVRSILVVLAVAMFFVIGVLGFMAYQKATAQGSYSPSAA